MKVFYLDFKRRVFNRIKLISSSLLLVSVPMIAATLPLYSVTGIYSLVFGVVFLIIYSVSSGLNLINRSYIQIYNPSEYQLILNADQPIDMLRHKRDLGYSKNFLIQLNGDLNQTIEIERDQAFKLLKSGKFQAVNIQIQPCKLSFLELNPNGVMNFIYWFDWL